jgi:hypothetical protein
MPSDKHDDKHDDKQKKPNPNVDKKEIQAFVKRQPAETQKVLKKALKERGLWDEKKDAG